MRLTGRDKDRKALVADGIKVGFDVFLDDGFAADGAISLLLADITGMLSCRDADLAGRDNDGLSLAGYGMRVTGDVWLDGRFTAIGGISLAAAQVGRTVWLRGNQPRTKTAWRWMPQRLRSRARSGGRRPNR